MSRTVSAVTAMGLGAVLVAGAGTAVAAGGGHPLLRGKANHERHTTSLVNRGTGPALSLKSRAGTPPLRVSNSTKVARLNADKLDGLTSGALQRRINGSCASGHAIRSVSVSGAVTCASIPAALRRTVVISPGNTATANGNALIAVLAAVPSPSSTNPWLVKLEPGMYDLGDQTLHLRSYTDLEGSGVGVTTIQGTGANGGYSEIVGTDHTDVRQLTIHQVNLGAAYESTGSTNETLHDVTVSGDETGIFSFTGGADLLVSASTLTGGFAVNDNGGRIEINTSRISAGGMSTGSSFLSAELDIADSLVDVPGAGIQDNNGATLACVGTYNAHYVALNTSCT